MAVVGALNLPETSPFRDPDQVPLLENPTNEESGVELSVAGDEKGEGEDNSSMRNSSNRTSPILR